MKLSFKKQPREKGLAAVGNPYPNTDIKANGKKIGYIQAPNWRTKDGLWRVAMSIKKKPSPEEPADFQWVFFKAKHESEEKAREWIQKGWDHLQKVYDFYQFDD